MTASRCPVHEEFDPLAPEFLADPYAVLASLPLDEAPLFYAPSIGYYVLTRYADIEQVFRDPATFSAAAVQAPLVPLVPEAAEILLAGGHRPQPSMVSLDEPAHARLRKPAARAFSVTRIQAMIPAIEATTARLLDAVAGQAEFDLVAALAFPLPANIVFSLMGVPESDFAQLKQWCGSRAALGWGRPAPGDQVEIATSMAAYRRYLRDLVNLRAAQPRDDLTTALLAITASAPTSAGWKPGSRWRNWPAATRGCAWPGTRSSPSTRTSRSVARRCCGCGPARHPDYRRHRRCRAASSMLTLSITSAASTSSDTVPTQ
jgi:cytochrome P450